MANNNGQMTIKKLLALCKEEIAKGNGDKYIVISDDNEGNGFHGLFYGFSPYEEEYYKDYIYDSNANSVEDTIILG